MASTVKSRPNHYEALGIAPSASAQEIGRAFAKRMFLPHMMDDAAQIGVAYEVLRNAAKRKAYDESLGIGRVADAPAAPRAVSFRISAHMAGAGPDAKVATETQTTIPAERAVGAFIASSLRPDPAPRQDGPPVAPRAAVLDGVRVRDVQDPVRGAPVIRRLGPVETDNVDQTPGLLTRPALVLGGLVVGVALLGAWAGVTAGNEAETNTLQPKVTMRLPKAKAMTAPVATSSAAGPVVAEIEYRRPEVRARAARPIETAAVVEAPSAPATPASETVEASPGAADPLAPSASETPAAVAVAASLPLSNATIARTIGRIGYACGSVASTEATGEAGVFKVTCTSGQSYRASATRGRYRFKRL